MLLLGNRSVKLRHFKRPLVLCVSALTLSTTSGCGKNPAQNFIKDITAKTYVQDGDAYAEIQAGIDAANLQMPAFELPILDPRHPGSVYGRVGMKPRLGGGAELSIAVNLTDVAQVPGDGARLPNGAALPVGGLDGSRVVGLPVGDTGARVYVAVDRGVAMIGTALALREFNEIGRYVGGANLFLPFQFNNGVRGIAGIFTGQGDRQSGFALFVDASALLPQQQLLARGLAVSRSSLSLAALPIEPKNLVFARVKPSASREDRLNERLYYLNKKRARLSLN